MKTQIFTGSGCAIVTPFNDDQTINFEKFADLIEFQIAGNTDAIVVMGTTGEASTLYDEDHLAAIEFCVKQVNGRVPVVAGCGSNHTEHGIKLSVEAEQAGADGLLHVTPYYNKTSQQGLIAHYKAIAESVDLPIILYNVPGRTGMTFAPSTYLELSKIPNIVATKEASGDLSLVAKTAALCGDNLKIYSGNDDQTIPIMSLGGIGTISVLANVIPQTIHDLCQAGLDEDFVTARKIQLDIIELNSAMFCDVNPIPVREALNQMGFQVGEPKLPLVGTSDANKAQITQALTNLGIKVGG